MGLRKLFSTVLCVGLASCAGGCWAAQAGAAAPGKKLSGILLPPAVEISSPFAMDAPESQRVNTIAFLSQDQMGSRDRQAVQNASAALAEKAALRGFNLKLANWSYQQIACPIFPGHILLLFTRNEGIGDVSEFSAVLPRGNGNAPHILPILRRSYSPYDPAPVNPVTLAAFNALRAQTHRGQKDDWLTTGLCYAALSGVHVQLAPAHGRSTAMVSLAAHSLLQIDGNGAASVRFFDVENPEKITSWELNFDSRGKLMRVAVTPVPALKTKLLP